ncbi:23S rRNA (adenine(1618)-N(6))-methyltransferase RlmF [Mariniflexile ostreae]|uniref:Ribosomal RNA large subunit methyltransferase F n=1 Tax=Mariniflexile ostreae TaxID=1520892 RepID=A0ABV5F867_9FLAO
MAKKNTLKKSPNVHPNNKHRSGYDLDVLCIAHPSLSAYVFENNYLKKTIDFADPKAVKALNTALIKKEYNIKYWDFSDVNLCPPIPGRVEYIHYIADLLKSSKIEENISVLDIGTGASCIYPLLGHAVYHWSFVGTDINNGSLKQAQNIINKNLLQDVITLRYQKNSSHILKDIIKEEDKFAVSICNPPFYKSENEALETTIKKTKGLHKQDDSVVRNFSGTHHELWYKGGEKAFVHNYIFESSLYKNHCVWFTTLISKKDLIKGIYASLEKLGATKIKTIDMEQGNKKSRIIAWTFQTFG